MILVLLALAVARTTRLIRDDSIFDRPRGWLLNELLRDNGFQFPYEGSVRKWLHDLLRCPWCISGWLAAGAVALGDWFYSIPLPGLAWLAVWWGACLGYWLLELVAETHDEIWRKRDDE